MGGGGKLICIEEISSTAGAVKMGSWKKITFATGLVAVVAVSVICLRSTDQGQNPSPHNESSSGSSAVATDAQPMASATVTGVATAPNPARQMKASRPRLADDAESLSQAADAIKLWEPQALNNDQRLAMAASRLVMWNPKTPADFVQEMKGADPALARWLYDWQLGIASGKQNPGGRVSELNAAVANSKLTPEECVQATRLLAGWEDSRSDQTIAYHRLTAVFARQAIWSTSKAIHLHPGTIGQAQAVVAPLIRRLWWGVEPEMDGPQLDLHAVKEFYTLLWQFSPVDSADHHRGQEGRIEAMIFLPRN